MSSNHNGEIVTQEDYLKPMREMGEVGESAINNIRKVKTKKHIVVKADDTDKDHELLDSQEQAIVFAREELGRKFNHRSSNKAPDTLVVNGLNPTKDYILKRWWGIHEKIPVRMVPTVDNKWCIYWRPSLISRKIKAT
jgi:hypothetical protein